MPHKNHQQSKWIRIVPLAILILLVVLYYLWPAFQQFIQTGYQKLAGGKQGEIRDWVGSFGTWGFLVILSLFLLQTVIPVLPSVAPMVIAVLAYGPYLGGGLAWGGLILSAIVAYGIGKALGPVTLHRIIGEKSEKKMESFVDRYGLWGIVAARISPALSTDAVSLVAGLMKMAFAKFFLATAGGTLPLVILIAWLGEKIDRLKAGLIWISAVSLLAFAIYVWYDRRKSGQATANDNS